MSGLNEMERALRRVRPLAVQGSAQEVWRRAAPRLGRGRRQRGWVTTTAVTAGLAAMAAVALLWLAPALQTRLLALMQGGADDVVATQAQTAWDEDIVYTLEDATFDGRYLKVTAVMDGSSVPDFRSPFATLAFLNRGVAFALRLPDGVAVAATDVSKERLGGGKWRLTCLINVEQTLYQMSDVGSNDKMDCTVEAFGYVIGREIENTTMEGGDINVLGTVPIDTAKLADIIRSDKTQAVALGGKALFTVLDGEDDGTNMTYRYRNEEIDLTGVAVNVTSMVQGPYQLVVHYTITGPYEKCKLLSESPNDFYCSLTVGGSHYFADMCVGTNGDGEFAGELSFPISTGETKKVNFQAQAAFYLRHTTMVEGKELKPGETLKASVPSQEMTEPATLNASTELGSAVITLPGK